MTNFKTLRVRKRTLACAVLSGALALLFLSPAVSSAQAAAPQWTISAVSTPTNFSPTAKPGEDRYSVLLTNTGSATSSGPVKIADELPTGLSLDPVGAFGEVPQSGSLHFINSSPELSCALATCTFSGAIVPDESISLTFPVDVAAPAGETLTNVIRASGGGGASASISTPTEISEEPAPFAIAPGAATTALSTTQAGAHADITNTYGFTTVDAQGSLAGDPKDVIYRLPPGFASDFRDTPECSAAQFAFNECPTVSQVGITTVDTLQVNHILAYVQPVYNLAAGAGQVAKLGFSVGGAFLIQGAITLEPRRLGAEVTFANVDDAVDEIPGGSLTVWGDPASPIHDPLRGEGTGNSFTYGHPSSANPTPYFTNPTACGTEELRSEFRVDSWQQPGAYVSAQMPYGPIVECDRLTINPTLEAQPSSDSAETATGLNVDLHSPQLYENAEGNVASNLDDTKVTLPEGMSLNPSAGSGLGSCTEAQLSYEAGTAEPLPGLGCPNESKVGTIKVHSPVLAEEATGSLFVAKPFENPFHSLLALYLVARIPARGVVVTAAGHVEANPQTGQLTTTFDESPQLPFDHFTLSFHQGGTSPLITPPTCGAFTTNAVLTPWSVPTQQHPLSGEFEILHGVNGGPCPTGGVPPFHPDLLAGTTNNAAGHYSPFYVRLERHDGEQEITHFSIKLPPGVSGRLAGVARCSDAAIAQAKGREHEGGGAEEEADPSCPAASEVGRTIVEAGVGSVLAQAPGKVYLAGPYHGAPISVVSITAAKVGPFDLGTVVVREALKVNPETAEVFVDSTGSDPIPHIVDGIPTHLRDIRIYMNRPEFALNPTSCEPTSTASTVLGSGKDFVSEADDQPVTVTSPYQAADCAALGFKPKLRLELKGKKTRRGGLPGLKATLTARPGDANIGEAQVTLPPSEFLEQGHLKNVCPRSVWIQGQVPGEECPASSIYGHARATTPLLEAPLEGPVYLRTGYGTRLPEMVAALNGEEINVDVVGEIDSVHQKGSEISLLRNTFKTVPDAPVTRFELELEGGKKGLLVNSTNVCEGTHRAEAAFTGQNGKLDTFHPTLVASCGKKKGGHSKKHGKGRKAGGHGKKGK